MFSTKIKAFLSVIALVLCFALCFTSCDVPTNSTDNGINSDSGELNSSNNNDVANGEVDDGNNNIENGEVNNGGNNTENGEVNNGGNNTENGEVNNGGNNNSGNNSGTTEEKVEYKDVSVLGYTVPAYSGNPYYILNNNQPFFTSNEIVKVSYEKYSALDSLGRCTVAMSCIGKDLMPTEDRGSISSVTPSGRSTWYFWSGDHRRSILVSSDIAASFVA